MCIRDRLYKALAVLASIFILGIIASFLYSRLMVKIGQGVLKRVRDEMFEHMQTLPIRSVSYTHLRTKRTGTL